MSGRSIELKDVGPVERLTIPIPEGGGVVVLRGRNGQGKSHALQAVGALVGGNGRPVSRDGSLGASVEGLGARLTVGRRSSHSGEVEVESLEGEDPSLLVDPGLKDQAAADGHRLKALLRLSRATVDESAFAELVGGIDRLRELCKPSSLDARDDVPGMVAAIKRDLEAAARVEESAAENAHAKADGVREALKGLGDLRPRFRADTRSAREFHTEAVREQAALEERRGQNQQLLDASEVAQAGLARMGEDGKGDVDEVKGVIEKNRIALAALGDEGDPHRLATARGLVETTRVQVEQLRLEIDRAERDLKESQRNVEAHEKAAETRAQLTLGMKGLEHILDSITHRGALQRAADASAGATAITDVELAAAAEKLQTASDEVDAWVLHDKTRSMRDEVAEHDDRGKAAAKDGDALRRAAQGTEAVLLDAVRKVCGDGMEIQDGRIYVATDRGRELFSELSPGERWRMALEVSVKAVGSKGLLVIPQDAWEAMDPLNRQEVAAHAQDLGVVVLTAECDEGEIRAEVEAEVVRA